MPARAPERRAAAVIDGAEVCRRIKVDETTDASPIVMIAGAINRRGWRRRRN
ncbi:MAG: hypothetical protein KIT31_12605 [Deltaproteobacteria bacterium]|nr:hypothetical protein [Deltaproteobacteria bacterium]